MSLQNVIKSILVFLTLILPISEGIHFDLNLVLIFICILPLTIFLVGKRVHQDKIFWLFLLFLFIGLLATIFSSNLGRSLTSLFLYYSYFIVFLATRTAIGNKGFKQFFSFIILTVGLFLVLLSFYFLIFNKDLPFGGMNLLYASFGHNHLVDYLIFAFPLSLAFLQKQIIRKSWDLTSTGFLFLSLILLSGFIVSFSRGGILIATLEIIFFTFAIRKSKHISKQKLAVGQLLNFLIGFFLVLYLCLGIFGYYFGKDKIKDFDSFLPQRAFRNLSIIPRIDYWKQALLAFKQRPILGWGLDNFRYISLKYQSRPNAWSWFTHNHFLQMFTETGFFGGIIFLFLVLLIVKKIKLLKRSNPNLINEGFKTGLIASIIYSFFDYGWQFSSVFILFWLITGLLLKTNNQKSLSANSRLLKTFLLTISLLVFVYGALLINGELLILKGGRLLAKGEIEASMSYFVVGSHISPYNTQEIINLAEKLASKGKQDLALTLVKRALIWEKSNWKNYKMLGDIYSNLENNQNKKRALANYSQAINLNPIGNIDLYFQMGKVYRDLNKEDKEKEIILNFITRYQKINNFLYLSLEGRDYLAGLISYYSEKDPIFVFYLMEKIESFVGKEMFEFFSWEQRQELIRLLKNTDFSQSNNLNLAQKGKYFSWVSFLSLPNDSDNNLKLIQKWLEQATKHDPSNSVYKEYLAKVVTFRQAKEFLYMKQYEQARSKLNILIADIDSSKQDFMPDYQRLFYSRIFECLAKSYAWDNSDQFQQEIKYHWEKAREFDPGNKNYLEEVNKLQTTGRD